MSATVIALAGTTNWWAVAFMAVAPTIVVCAAACYVVTLVSRTPDPPRARTSGMTPKEEDAWRALHTPLSPCSSEGCGMVGTVVHNGARWCDRHVPEPDEQTEPHPLTGTP